ncbi:MAG: cupin domain-containing protein [Pseudomonadota bacterium]
MNFGELSVATFLRDYWQKKPLLIRNGFPGFVDPISPEELAGLACEDEVDARLVFSRGKTWKMTTGPFAETDFTSLPSRNWTLLVQAVDQWVPEVKALLESVNFIPNWRVDDVMISYATPNGGVGPHFDYYDVFLVQGQGSRIWKTGQHCTSDDLNRTSSGLKLLAEFHSEDEWLLEPGDVLYVPPGVAHWGVSRDNSLCYSLGFRAPSVSEMVLGYSDSCSDSLAPDLRYTDPKLKPGIRAGEIAESSLQQMQKLLKDALSDKHAMNMWFGSHMTQPKNPDQFVEEEFSPDIRQQNLALIAHPAARFAWQQTGQDIAFFANGEVIQCFSSPRLLKLMQQLCTANSTIATASYSKHKVCRNLLEALLAQGVLLVEDEQ